MPGDRQRPGRHDDRRRHPAPRIRSDRGGRRPARRQAASAPPPSSTPSGNLVGLLRDEDLIVVRRRTSTSPTIGSTFLGAELPCCPGVAAPLRARAQAHGAGSTSSSSATSRSRVPDREAGRHPRPGRRERDATNATSPLPVVDGRQARRASSPAATSSGASPAPTLTAVSEPMRPSGRRSTSALRHNVRTLAGSSAGCASGCVKADGYGPRRRRRWARRGSTPARRGLGVRSSKKAPSCAAAGIDAPILVPVEPAAAAATAIVAQASRRSSTRVGRHRRASPRPVADTGARRWLPCAPQGRHRHAPRRLRAPRQAALANRPRGRDRELRARRRAAPTLAVADEPDNPYTPQAARPVRRACCGELAVARGMRPDVATRPTRRRLLEFADAPASTSCAAVSPCTASPGARARRRAVPLRPAMAVKARVSHVKRLLAGARRSRYGFALHDAARGTVATVPVGYADGVPRRCRRRARRCSSVVIAIRWPAPSPWTSSWSTSAARRWRSATRSCCWCRDGRRRDHSGEWAERLGTIGYEIGVRHRLRAPRPTCDGPRGACERSGRTRLLSAGVACRRGGGRSRCRLRHRSAVVAGVRRRPDPDAGKLVPLLRRGRPLPRATTAAASHDQPRQRRADPLLTRRDALGRAYG